MKVTSETIDRVYKSEKCSIETMELKGYRLVKEFFVDSSGFGLESEPALTVGGFGRELKSLLQSHKVLYTTITDAGQFQVYIGVFTRDGVKSTVKIGNNLLQGKDFIRLYDTNIITWLTPSKVVLNSGGWQTFTTKKHINARLPNGFYVYQKDFNWYVQTPRGVVDFRDGMTLDL